MSDILSAFAILLAVFTYIESVYKDFIQEGIDTDKNIHTRDNKLNYKKVKKTVVSYQLPLLVISFIISLIMAPVSVEIIENSITYMSKGIAKYDIVATSILFLHMIFVVIFIKEINRLYKLLKKMKSLIYWK